MDDLCLISTFRLYPELQFSFEHNSVRKNLFLKACFCWDSKYSLRELDQNSNLEPLVMGTRTWSSNFVTSKYLDYMQY